jgi:hypothetical protein
LSSSSDGTSINEIEEVSDKSGAVVDSSREGIGAEGFEGAECGITTDDAASDEHSFSGVLGALVGSLTQMLGKVFRYRMKTERFKK